MTDMTAEIAAQLREPFAAEQVGKLPRVFCKACRDAQFKVCQQHTKRKCRVCGNNITDAHLHLDYVGHAEITDRLLHADPTWTWEPVALCPDGLPLRDQMGGLWIRLTVAGVTRLGYGHADGKTGPDAVKEAIGDALRNAAMRFGVALDLWGAKFKDGQHDDDPEPEPEAPRPDPEKVRQQILDSARRAIAETTTLDGLAEYRQRVDLLLQRRAFTEDDANELRQRIERREQALANPQRVPRRQRAQVEDRTADAAEPSAVEPAEQQPMEGEWPEPRKPGSGDPA